MKIRHFLTVVALAVGLASAARAAGAQVVPLAPREKLAARLDSGAVAAIMPVIDAAAGQGLPLDPLVQKALEGASKHASAERIVLAVRRLSTQLASARLALGNGASSPELVAGASALQAGVRPEVLATLRDERPQASLAVPLGVLAELIARGVPADTGAMAVVALVDAKVSDTQLVALRQDVERDIGVGAPPTTALIARTSGLADASFLAGPRQTGNGRLEGNTANTGTGTTRRRP